MAHISQLPNTGVTGDAIWADVEENDQAIVDVINGGLDNTNIAAGAAIAASKLNLAGTLDTDDLTAAAGILDTQLASPNNSVYRAIAERGGRLAVDSASGTWVLSSEGAVIRANADGMVDPQFLPLFYLDDADFTVATKTTKLRLRAQVARNATAATITFTFGLYPVTVAGAADNLTYTAGTVVTGSTVAITNPATSTITSGTGSDFDVPTDGAYCLAVVTNAALANNAAVSVHTQLQMRHT